MSALRRPDRVLLGRVLLAVFAATLAVVTLASGPARAAEHVVRPGENLSTIAHRYRVTTSDLVRLNNLTDPNHLLVGTRLQLPGTAQRAAATTSSNTAKPAKQATASKPAAKVERAPIFDLADEQQQQVARELERAAVEFGVSPSLLKALTYTESRWRQDAVSATGAVGIGQLQPGTAEWLAVLMEEPTLDAASRADNIRMSAFLLRWLLDHTSSTTSALASYYQGIGSVLRAGVSSSGARYAKVIASRRTWFD